MQLLICCAYHAAPHCSCIAYTSVPYTCYLLPQTAVSAFLLSAPLPSLWPRAADCEVPYFYHSFFMSSLSLRHSSFILLDLLFQACRRHLQRQRVTACVPVKANERQAFGRTALSIASTSHSLLWQGKQSSCVTIHKWLHREGLSSSLA